MPDEVTPSAGATQDETALLPPASGEAETVWEERSEGAGGEFAGAQEQPSFWRRLKRALLGSGEAIEQRLRNLSLAIENSPDTPANYVLRGELYLEIAEYELAAADFQRALELASAQFEASDWGGIAQVMRDRAQAGLERAQHRLRHSSSRKQRAANR